MRIILFSISLVVFGFIPFKKGSSISEPRIMIRQIPVFPEKKSNDLIEIKFNSSEKLQFEKVEITYFKGSPNEKLSSVYIKKSNELISRSAEITSISNFTNNDPVLPGENSFIIGFTAKPAAGLSGTIGIKYITISFTNKTRQVFEVSKDSPAIRFGKVLRAGGQDKVNTYRIPGIITTKKGTLIAVYDNRYRRSKDLQEDIDVGMSRSFDGGETWEPMKVIMDMGEYGDKPQNLNGTGDPCILYDSKNNTIFVAALWMNGASTDKMLWNASQPGMNPDETGQIMIVKSNDDGLTWSQPVSITKQVKDPAWQLCFQAPGRGLTMKDGTLVIPAQFKKDLGEIAIDGGKYTSYSTIIFSKDGGSTWKIGTGVKPNTTECQAVELSDGTLMLNMRDDRNRKDKSSTNGRAIAVTSDLGKTWSIHPTSNSALPEPNCMASIISANITIGRKVKNVLFFSNPDNRVKRSDMTIKASLDDGMSWPEEFRLKINETEGDGYSCLTMVDKNTIGILYEGVKDLYFQKIPVKDILNE